MNVRKGTFSVHDKVMNLMVIDLHTSYYVWVGDESHICKELHGGFPLKNIKGEHGVSTTMMGDVDSISGDMAKALVIYSSHYYSAIKLSKPVFMSANIEETDTETLMIYQENLFNAITELKL